ncbi:uncharacterized protein PHACADRAFT_246067 [Phanerochaete carnosa HHB-10118-sp]|uniref:Uncharacterized protein n=1 Tax=Phanerochaete carnosa (strain HHB-10118-sp) TaxID=650164 RepID=K5VFV5_PHACS|nr:uncharacterized protein PHACADRAFT_246067 [Phanerochaete carnosa HHB-10118-sp]EKM61896.1 hypothetical protein PHACADRAFT_246067 [Phanerochaete carnosa HHB-10118-sp]
MPGRARDFLAVRRAISRSLQSSKSLRLVIVAYTHGCALCEVFCNGNGSANLAQSTSSVGAASHCVEKMARRQNGFIDIENVCERCCIVTFEKHGTRRTDDAEGHGVVLRRARSDDSDLLADVGRAAERKVQSRRQSHPRKCRTFEQPARCNDGTLRR